MWPFKKKTRYVKELDRLSASIMGKGPSPTRKYAGTDVKLRGTRGMDELRYLDPKHPFFNPAKWSGYRR